MAPPVNKNPVKSTLHLGPRVRPCQPGTMFQWRARWCGWEKKESLVFESYLKYLCTSISSGIVFERVPRSRCRSSSWAPTSWSSGASRSPNRTRPSEAVRGRRGRWHRARCAGVSWPGRRRSSASGVSGTTDRAAAFECRLDRSSSCCFSKCRFSKCSESSTFCLFKSVFLIAQTQLMDQFDIEVRSEKNRKHRKNASQLFPLHVQKSKKICRRLVFGKNQVCCFLLLLQTLFRAFADSLWNNVCDGC